MRNVQTLLEIVASLQGDGLGTRDDEMMGKDAIMDCIEPGHEVALLWVPLKESGGAKGRSYLLELILDHGSEAQRLPLQQHIYIPM